MFMLIHALVGMLFATKFNSVTLLLVFGIVSHFLLDMVPHWDGPFNWEEFNLTGEPKVGKLSIIIHVIDLISIVILFTVLVITEDVNSKHLMFGAFAALIPDFLKLGYATRLKKNDKYMKQLKFHSRIQRQTNWKIGLIAQIIIIVILTWTLFKIS